MSLTTKNGTPIPRSQKALRLDLENIPAEDRARAKREVGNYIINEILRFLERGKSPVEGETFPKLDKEYADAQKQGDRKPNLQLEGDLLDALKFVNTAEGIRIGIFKDGEQAKADGHNKFSGAKNNAPKRRFIPGEGQDFSREIMGEVNKILQGFRREPERQEERDDGFFDEFNQSVDITVIDEQDIGLNINENTSVSTFFSDDDLLALIEREALRNG